MKKILALLLALAMTFTLCACGQKATAPSTEAAPVEKVEEAKAVAETQNDNEKITLKICIQETEDHAQGVLIKTFKDEVDKISDGSLDIQLYFNGSLYNQDGANQALTTGELEMMTTSLQVTADYLPSLNMLTTPYIFMNYDHMRKVLDGEIGEAIFNEMLEKAPYVAIGYYYNGARELNLRSDNPINKPEDLSKVLLRMPNSEAWIAAGESLGAKVTTLAYSEVYTALQSGTIDAQDNPLPSDKSAKFYEVTKQICMTDHIIDAGLFAINTNVWNSLSEQQREWIMEAAKVAIKACDEVTLSAEAELVEFFENEGLTIVYPDKQAFADYSFKYYEDKGLTKDWDMDLYSQIKSLA